MFKLFPTTLLLLAVPHFAQSLPPHSPLNQDEQHGSLRSGNTMHDQNNHDHINSNNDHHHRKALDTPGDDDEVYVMVQCLSNEDQQACWDRIMASGPAGTLTISRYMWSVHACAVRTQYSNLVHMGSETEDDPVRYPLHMPESYRNLQVDEQVMPYGIELVKAPQVWEQFGTQGEGVKVCVLDSGLDVPHPDLDGVTGYEGRDLVQPWDEDDVTGHGTHVTGTIAASDNGIGVVGVAPRAEIISARVFDQNGEFHSSDIIAGLEACRASGARVINLSLGGRGRSRREQNTLNSFFENDGIVTVAAIGNTGGFELSFPAAYDYVVGVAAVDRNRNRASFSTRNSRIDVAAPGVRVASTFPNGRYAFLDGTSMASPHVAGVVALMLSVNPDATPTDIFLSLRNTAFNDNSPDEPDTLLGFGVVDALAAVQDISGGGAAVPIPAPTPAPAPTPTSANSGALAAQYLVTMQHFTDQVTGVDNLPGAFPLVRYMCRGKFAYINANQAMKDNDNLACTEISDDEGFSGWECLHECGPSVSDCSYWWNNDARDVAEGWEQAGFWFECSGDNEADTEAKFVWRNNGNTQLDLPFGSSASNGKVARLAVRTDYTDSDEDLISDGRFPPVDVTADHVAIGQDVNFRADRAPDGGYYGWTGVSGCSGDCSVVYAELELESDPATFPNNFFQQSTTASAPSPVQAPSSSEMASDNSPPSPPPLLVPVPPSNGAASGAASLTNSWLGFWLFGGIAAMLFFS